LKKAVDIFEPNCKEKINTAKSLQCDYIFLKTKSAPTTTITSNLLSLPGHEVHSIFQHYIKTLKPILCRQKEFVYSLQIFHQSAFLSTTLTLLSSIDFFLSQIWRHIALNQSAVSMTL